MPQLVHQFIVVEVQHILLGRRVGRLRRVCRRRLFLVHGGRPGAAGGLGVRAFAPETSKPVGAAWRPGRCHERHVRTGRHQGDQSRGEAVVSCDDLRTIQPRVREPRRPGTYLDGIALAMWGKEVAWSVEPSAPSTPAHTRSTRRQLTTTLVRDAHASVEKGQKGHNYGMRRARSSATDRTGDLTWAWSTSSHCGPSRSNATRASFALKGTTKFFVQGFFSRSSASLKSSLSSKLPEGIRVPARLAGRGTSMTDGAAAYGRHRRRQKSPGSTTAIWILIQPTMSLESVREPAKGSWCRVTRAHCLQSHPGALGDLRYTCTAGEVPTGRGACCHSLTSLIAQPFLVLRYRSARGSVSG